MNFGAILPANAVTTVVDGLTTAISGEMAALLGIAVGLGGIGYVLRKVFRFARLK